MPVFDYGQTELRHLQRKDKKLACAIEQIGQIRRSVNPDLFAALIHSIIAQQIATKAATTVWNRLLERCGEITPQCLYSMDAAEIQQCGLSMRKARYIHGASRAVALRELVLEDFPALPDTEIISRLSSLDGIGVWTAEMLLIFSLQRPDVVSWGDLAIRRGMMALYGRSSLTRTQFDNYRKRYSPYGSVASLYLWALAARKPEATKHAADRRRKMAGSPSK
jgi:DNA-3-methyladenine glycosylase II